MAFALSVFMVLFSCVVYQGVAGLFEPSITVQVDFKTQTPDQVFQNHQDVIAPGALKHLYEAFQKNPQYMGSLKVPCIRSYGTKTFSGWFFTQGNSSYAEAAGILGAAMGSFYVLCVTLVTALPLGLCAGTYLEELAPRGPIFRSLEVVISNLAAVPSLLYGLLGLVFFIQVLHVPRSSSLVGGLTLALMSLPTLVVGTRLALRSVPRHVRDSARALGASPMQVTLHHVVPMAFPYMMTSILISMARVCGETAPLLIVGLTAFSPLIPSTVQDPAMTLPVQIYMWSRHPDPAFIEKGAAAILVLGLFLTVLTLIALKIRRTYETNSDR